MNSLNKWCAIGNIGKDPEVKTLESGNKVANISLATTEKYKTKDGQKKEITEWHNLTFFGGICDIIEKYIKKGDRIYTEGKSKTKVWEHEGVKKYSHYFLCTELIMLSSKQTSTPITSNPFESMNDLEDDLPF